MMLQEYRKTKRGGGGDEGKKDHERHRGGILHGRTKCVTAKHKRKRQSRRGVTGGEREDSTKRRSYAAQRGRGS